MVVRPLLAARPAGHRHEFVLESTTGPTWEGLQCVAEASAGTKGSRTFRALLAFDASLLQPAGSEFERLRSSASAWEVVPLRFRQSRLQTSAVPTEPVANLRGKLSN